MLLPLRLPLCGGARWLQLVLLLLLVLCGFTYRAAPLAAQGAGVTPNPDLTPACGLDVILILDESGSVGPAAQTVRDGARALLTALADTGSRLALIEFNVQARAPLGAAYLPITSGVGGTISPGGAFDTYLNTGYNPTDGTNWDGALGLAANINATHGVADLIIFFTDGNPNIYVDSDGNNQPSDLATALQEALGTANQLKGQGSHLFGIGVGAVTEANLALVAGPDQYPNPTLPFGKTDYALVTFADFVTTFRAIADNLCTPYLVVTNLVDEANGAGYQPQAGWAFTGAVQVTTAGQAANSFSWLAPTPGAAAQLGQSQATTTNSSGMSQWQWTPGTINDPKLWTTALALQAATRPTYQFMGATCVRRTIDPLTAISETPFTLTTLPATLSYGPNDVIACTVRHARSALVVDKRVTPSTLPEPGGVVTYTVTVTNSGAVPLGGVTLVDDLLHNLQGQGTCLYTGALTLAPGATYQCAVPATLLGNAGARFDYAVAASAIVNGATIRATDNAVVQLSDVLPAAFVRKSAAPTTLPERGGPVTFAITVTNLSPVEPVQLTALVDSPYGKVTQLSNTVLATTCAVPQLLAPAGQAGAQYHCTFTVNLLGNAGQYPDQITATLADDEGNTITPTAQAVVTLTDLPSSLRVTKSVDRTTVPEPGGVVLFTVVVENTSAVDQVTITTLVDNWVAAPATFCEHPLPVRLDPGQQLRCAYPIQIQGNQGDSFTNQVVVTGVDDDGKALRDQDQATVVVSNVPSSLLVTKRAATTTVPEPGQPVSYTVTVSNTSAADAVTITALSDSAVPNVQTYCQPALPALLAPGAALHCRYQMAVQGQVGAVVINQFTARGLDDDGNLLTATDQEEVQVIDLPSAVTVTKRLSPATVPETGGAVDFQITVRNTSAVDQVTIQAVHDDRFGDVSATCTPALPAQLAVGGTVLCQFTRTLQGDVAAPQIGTATATGVDDDGLAVRGDGSAVLLFTDVKPTLTVQKVPNPAQVLETGGAVTFTFTVVNPGLEPLTLVQMLDAVLGNLHGQGSCQTPQLLAPGGSYRCTVTTFIQGVYGVNPQSVVAVYGQDNEGNLATATAQAEVVLLDAAPQLTVIKQDALAQDKVGEPAAYQGIVSPGDTLTYTLVVSNQGNQAATAVTVADTPDKNSQLLAGTVSTSQGLVQIGNASGETKVVVDLGTLAPGEQAVIRFAVLVMEGTGANQLINQATISHVDPTNLGGSNITLSDDPDTLAPTDATITPVSIPPTALVDGLEPSAPVHLYLPLLRQ